MSQLVSQSVSQSGSWFNEADPQDDQPKKYLGLCIGFQCCSVNFRNHWKSRCFINLTSVKFQQSVRQDLLLHQFPPYVGGLAFPYLTKGAENFSSVVTCMCEVMIKK